MLGKKDNLYRKANTKARGMKHRRGSNSGLDYTPLFMFLLSKVGRDWNEVFSEAKPRLDRVDPIFWIVARTEGERQDIVRIGESTYYSGLFIDDDNILRIVNPELRLEDMEPQCSCCTHTFNGKVFTRKYKAIS